jgi:hypothetical protein
MGRVANGNYPTSSAPNNPLYRSTNDASDSQLASSGSSRQAGPLHHSIRAGALPPGGIGVLELREQMAGAVRSVAKNIKPRPMKIAGIRDPPVR